MHKYITNAIKKQYNTCLKDYLNKRQMQSESLNKLLSYLEKFSPNKKGVWLDVGCGPATLAFVKSEWSDIQLFGIDLSEEMANFSKQSGYDNCFVSDLTSIKGVENNSVDVYFSNSVLHWANFSTRSIEAAVKEIKRVLKPDGLFAVSIAGSGTSKEFIKTYHSTIEKVRQEKGIFNINNIAGIKVNLLTDNPLGSVYLDQTVDLFDKFDFKIFHATMEYEPIFFQHPLEYFQEIKVYGKSQYMLPFSHIEGAENIFDEIGFNFANSVKTPYNHKQYNVYIVGQKQ